MDNATPVLESMHNIVLLEEREDTEYTRLVQIEHLVLQVLETHRTVEAHQGAIDQDTVYRCLDRLMLQMLYDGLGVHIVEMLDVRTLRCWMLERYAVRLPSAVRLYC